MITCDVLIVGGGPAGSTCAWQLSETGLDVLLVDKAVFPRDKVCAGWITPQVVQSLQLNLTDYAQGRVLQPIDGFHVSLFEQPGIDIDFGKTVSYGIRRCEFDHYLLERAQVRQLLGTSIHKIEKTATGWRLNDEIETRLLVGAGGQFCPVAKRFRAEQPARTQLVTAVEAEFSLAADETVPERDPRRPYLCFREDLSGYGWCFHKGGYYNIGLGLVDSRQTAAEITRFTEILKRDQIYTAPIPTRFRGHAYYLYDGCRSELSDDGVLLIGDSAGLAYAQSGEGIRPAVESGLIAAEVILQARGDYSRAKLSRYRTRLLERLGPNRPSLGGKMLGWLGQGLSRALVRRLMRWPQFVRSTVIDQGFLHSRDPALLPGSKLQRQTVQQVQ